MKASFLLLSAFYSIAMFCQHDTNLSEALWARVQNCYSLFEDEDGNGIPDYNKIDDSQNGYLKVYGDWPTCGCSCTSTVGAYKDSNGDYCFVQQEVYTCEWKKSITSNRDLAEILPENFGIDTFSKEKVKHDSTRSMFYLEVEIPRVGTDTEFTLKLIPFGITIESSSLITFGYSENHPEKKGWHSQAELLYKIKNLARLIDDDRTLDLLIKGEYDLIESSEMDYISQQMIGTDYWGQFESLEILSKKLKFLKSTYDIYFQLDFTTALMKWDRIKAKFEIKSLDNKPEKISFKEFLLLNYYWQPVC
ncbi:hypothetical protein [Flagellimonas meishanensis]|uniref:hypothetical protein n=1 Tax=Flagellimonas meishanensis TaxID=2873264 RepID=UPI001CA6F483|nr:hypothetical protein [[Muricauda] meishanensis]